MEKKPVFSNEEEWKLRQSQMRARNGKPLSAEESARFIAACEFEWVKAQTVLACLEMAMSGKIDADLKDGEIVWQTPSFSAGE